MCEATYIDNNQQTLKNRMDIKFSDFLCVLINGQKLYSFAAHSEQHFNTTSSRTYIRKYMMFKVVKQLNPIGVIKLGRALLMEATHGRF